MKALGALLVTEGLARSERDGPLLWGPSTGGECQVETGGWLSILALRLVYGDP